ncbi:cytochrome b-c1 complex subunit 7-like [Pectinophora gossypiella]|uniref:cytochrome b-c1 complex subunit 7-like n=1 Tax=Pectinophora gossypiella TaxID=13191 RepID=UPI00214EFF8E|nr:cytochrome b-c1 complex subunit 7-like [Pectinophora gossypiella]
MAFRATPVVRSAMRKWAYNLAGFNRYGLRRDDTLYDEDQDVKVALRRLPKHVLDERTYRQLRALQLSIQKDTLPKDQWTKYEEDTLYLTPIVDQVRREREEREAWESEY